jgi:hypothetical protein
MLPKVFNEILIQMNTHLLEHALYWALIPVFSIHDLPYGLPQPLVQLNNKLFSFFSVLVLSGPDGLADGVFSIADFFVILHPREELLLHLLFALLLHVQLMLLLYEGILVRE